MCSFAEADFIPLSQYSENQEKKNWGDILSNLMGNSKESSVRLLLPSHDRKVFIEAFSATHNTFEACYDDIADELSKVPELSLNYESSIDVENRSKGLEIMCSLAMRKVAALLSEKNTSFEELYRLNGKHLSAVGCPPEIQSVFEGKRIEILITGKDDVKLFIHCKTLQVSILIH